MFSSNFDKSHDILSSLITCMNHVSLNLHKDCRLIITNLLAFPPAFRQLNIPGTIMINLAVVGCGYWGPNLIRNIIACPKTNLSWVCDTDNDNLQKALASFPTIPRTNDIKKILLDNSIQGIVIATPVSTHYSLAKSCLEHGKHVLIEKPMTANLFQAESLVALAQRENLQIMCDHTFCYTGAVKKIKELVQSGEVGDLLYYDSIRINLGLFQTDVNVIWDLAIHDLAIVDFLVGLSPISVNALGMAHTGTKENIAYMTLFYPNSFIAHFHVNWLAPVKIRKTLIGGSKKMIEWNDLVPAEKIKIYDKGINIQPTDRDEENRIRVSYRSGDIYSPYIDSREALSIIIEEFVKAIEYNQPSPTDGFAGLRTIKILEAANRSLLANGQNITIGE